MKLSLLAFSILDEQKHCVVPSKVVRRIKKILLKISQLGNKQKRYLTENQRKTTEDSCQQQNTEKRNTSENVRKYELRIHSSMFFWILSNYRKYVEERYAEL